MSLPLWVATSVLLVLTSSRDTSALVDYPASLGSQDQFQQDNDASESLGAVSGPVSDAQAASQSLVFDNVQDPVQPMPEQLVTQWRNPAIPFGTGSLGMYPATQLSLRQAAIRQHLGTSHTQSDDARSLRPGAGSGSPDVVRFGLFAKSFFGAKLKHNVFTADIVMSLKWNDARAAALVPASVDSLQTSNQDAMKKMWMPEVVITNRNIRSYELISSSVTVSKGGEVHKVERAIVTCLNRYDLEQYPFDTQSLVVKVASFKYMSSEVVLEPDPDALVSGVKPDLFDSFPYELEEYRVHVIDETDGAMQKSRGVLEIIAKRTFDKYGESHLLPLALLLVISWGVFWFPFENPFITPRLALSVLALLSFTNLVINSNNKLPDGAPCNWNDVLNFQVQALMFCTIVLNIFTEVCKHQLKLEDVAAQINTEAMFVMPLLSIAVITLILTAGKWKWMSVEAASIVTKLIIVVAAGVYMGCTTSSLQVATTEKERIAAEKQQEEDAAQKQLKLLRAI